MDPRVFLPLLLAGFVLFLSIWLIRTGMKEQRQRELIRRDGVATTGTITERKSRSREPGSVYYTFQHEGKTCTGEQRISLSHMDTINVGETVDIRYLPYNPTIALLAGKDEDNPWSTIPIVAGCLMLILILAFVGFLLIVIPS